MTGSDWSNQGGTSPNGTDEYKTTESQSQGVIAPKSVAFICKITQNNCGLIWMIFFRKRPQSHKAQTIKFW